MGNFGRWLGGGNWGPRSAANTGVEKLAAVQIQKSAWGSGLPIVYGTNRVAGNLIYTNDFKAIENKQKQGVGKGGGSVTTVSYEYTVTAILAMCEGPIAGVNVVWADLDKKTLSFYGWNLFTGALGQAAWGYLTTNHPADAIPYSGTAYVAAAPLPLGGTNSLKNFSFEVQGLNIIGGGVQDAQPADVIPDLLSNARYGAGWDSSRIGNLALGQNGLVGSSFRRYCDAQGFYLSPVIAEQKSAADHLRELLEATNSDAVFSQGVLNIFPYGDQAVTGNGVTFTPATTPIYDLTEDDFIVSSPDDDPVTVVRAALSDTFNTVPVEFTDRANDYNRSTVQDPEPNDADRYGQRTAPSVSLPCITTQPVALQISRIKAQRSIYVRNTYRFTCGWSKILLDPMDLVTLSDSHLGLVKKVVRVKSITETPEGLLQFEAEEWPFGVATPTLYATQTGDGGTPNTAVDPGNVTVPMLFDVPYLYFADGRARVAVALAGGQYWGGCDVWVSADNVTYSKVGSMTGKSRYGVTTSSFAAGTGFDTTHTVGVDLTISGGALTTTTDTSAQALNALCLLDGEFVSFATATLTGANAYTLSRLQRGVFGTAGAAHLTAKPFARVDENVFLYDVPDQYLGSTLYFKFPSVNLFGGGQQDLSSVSAYTFAPSTTVGLQPPYPDTVTLSLSASAPGASTPNTIRARLAEQSGVLTADPTNPALTPMQYATVAWSAVSIYPASLLTGYEVVLYTGSDPNDQSKYVVPKVTASATTVNAAVALPPDYNGAQTITAAVRAMYGTDPSAWRTSSGTVVLSPGTVPLNVPLNVEFIQTSRRATTTTFTITVRDPIAKLTTGTVFIAWAGLTSLTDNGTGSPAAASKAVTFGTAYSFTATVGAQFGGTGYAKFRAVASGRGDGYFHWFAAEQDQYASPTVVISIGSNQSSSDKTAKASAVINTPDNIATIKWLASTSSYPAQSTVAASGTSVAGGSPFAIADLGVTLNFGDTVYLTVITIDAFSVITGLFYQAKAVRSNLSATKTAHFNAQGSFDYHGNPLPDGGSISSMGDIELSVPTLETIWGQQMSFGLADGCTVTAIRSELYRDDASASNVTNIYARSAASPTPSSFATVTGANTGTYAQYAASCSQTSTGIRFYVSHVLHVSAGVGKCGIRSFEVDYLPSDPQSVT